MYVFEWVFHVKHCFKKAYIFTFRVFKNMIAEEWEEEWEEDFEEEWEEDWEEE